MSQMELKKLSKARGREKEKSPWWDEESNLEGNPRRRGRRYDKWCHEQQKFTDLNPK